MGGSSAKPTLPEVDLTGKTAIVTGANSGIGYVTARELAVMGARVIVACRSEQKVKTALETMETELRSRLGESGATACLQRVQFMQLDLASLASVARFSRDFQSRGEPLHLLICNAGSWFTEKALTEDGNESGFQVNYLSHFLLILLLLPALRNSGSDARIVSLSSGAHIKGRFDLTNIQAQRSFEQFQFYANSKMFQIMMTRALQRRLAGAADSGHVTVFAVHPGMVETNFIDGMGGFVKSMVHVARVIGWTTTSDRGAMTTLHVATDADVVQHSGSYFNDKCRLAAPISRATKVEDQEALWRYSLERLEGFLPPDLPQELRAPPPQE